MRKLNAGVRALRMKKRCYAGQRRNVLVLPEAQILRADAAFRCNSSRFGENQAGSADSAAAQVNQVPVVGEAVFAGVLAHGRDDDPVRQREGANLQRREKACGVL